MKNFIIIFSDRIAHEQYNDSGCGISFLDIKTIFKLKKINWLSFCLFYFIWMPDTETDVLFYFSNAYNDQQAGPA